MAVQLRNIKILPYLSYEKRNVSVDIYAFSVGEAGIGARHASPKRVGEQKRTRKTGPLSNALCLEWKTLMDERQILVHNISYMGISKHR